MSNNKKVPPRAVPDRDSKYMALAWIIAGFSKDPNTQCGAMLIDSLNNPLGWGYNGPPRLIDDKSFSWSRPDKYDKIIHAEINALIKCDYNFPQKKIMYVTISPCMLCSKAIINAGISKIVYHREYRDSTGIELLKQAGLEVVKFDT